MAEEGLELLSEDFTLHLASKHRFSQPLAAREVVSYYSIRQEHKGWAIIDLLKGCSPDVCFLLFSPTARQHCNGAWADQGGDEHTGPASWLIQQ